METKKNNHSLDISQRSKDWEGTVEKWFAKLPPLSKNAREAIVSITPWIALIFGIIGIIFSIMNVLSPSYSGSIISAILGLFAAALLLAAYQGTKAEKYQGWKMLFWSEVINLLASVLSFSPIGIIINLVGFYLLFQIKPYYR